MFKKLTEQYTRDNVRDTYVNMNMVARVVPNGTGSRLFIASLMVDVLEKPEDVLEIEPPILLTDTKDELDAGSRDEDGRVANSA